MKLSIYRSLLGRFNWIGPFRLRSGFKIKTWFAYKAFFDVNRKLPLELFIRVLYFLTGAGLPIFVECVGFCQIWNVAIFHYDLFSVTA